MKALLGQVLAAVRARHAALVGEVAGYLVLAAADQALHTPRLADLDGIWLLDSGEVLLEGNRVPGALAESSLRTLLGVLLDEVRSPFPNLRRVADRNETRGVSFLVTELEAALVPVNRKAAQRSLSRLARETLRSGAEWDGTHLPLGQQRPSPAAFAPAAPEPPEPDDFSTGVPVGDIEPVIEKNPFSERPASLDVAATSVPSADERLRGPRGEYFEEGEAPDSSEDSEDEPTLIRNAFVDHQATALPSALEPMRAASAEPLEALLRSEAQASADLEFEVDFDEFELTEARPLLLPEMRPEMLPERRPDLPGAEPGLADLEPGLVEPEPGLAEPEPGLVELESSFVATIESLPRSNESVTLVDRGSAAPESLLPASSRYWSTRPRSDLPPPSGPLIAESDPPEPRVSDISALLASLRRDAFPREELYRALSSLAEEDEPSRRATAAGGGGSSAAPAAAGGG